MSDSVSLNDSARPHDVVLLGADHAGYALKEELKQLFDELAYAVIDVGTFSAERCDYPDVAHRLSERLLQEEAPLGVLVCGSGVGMAISANRHRGVRAVVCSEAFSARLAREHNDANVLCLGARVVGSGLAVDILRAFLTASFAGGRHLPRVQKIEPAHSPS